MKQPFPPPKATLAVWGKKFLLCTAGLIVMALGVVFFLRSGLGVDPISVWEDGLSKALGIRFGTAALSTTAIIMTISLFVARKNIGIGTIYSAVGFGPTMNILEALLADVLPADAVYAMPVRILMLGLGMLGLCAGIAFLVAARFGYNVTDILLFQIAENTRFQYRWIKVITDCLFVLAGFLLGGAVGVGTIVSALGTGPLVTFFVRLYNRTLLKAMGLADERNELRKEPAK